MKYRNGELDYLKLKQLKDRIHEIKSGILEGVKIRARIQEQVEGEKVSNYLIGKQTTIKSKKLINSVIVEEDIVEAIKPGTKLNNKDSYEWYIRQYYMKLYGKEKSDEGLQKWFVNFIDHKITNEMEVELDKDVNDQEIYEAVKALNLNKSPGIDGISSDFYLKYWDIVGVEVSQVVKNLISGAHLQGKQRNAIITLIPKDGNPELLKTWRPISLICTDIKIVAKVLANRLKPYMSDLISDTQYCANGKSIVECNMQMRDIMYYAGAHKLTGAIANLDWEKAFDRVSWTFLVQVMRKLGFSNFIIKWFINLYTNITSSCLINGYITKEFKIERGVRQGCPLSMFAFVLFQEPLYRALEKSRKISPLDLPCKPIKQLGYADDTSILIRNDESFIECFRILKMFERATNSKMNLQKTKVYGFGNWEGRVQWPLAGLKIEHDKFKSLGIIFSCNYNLALEEQWKTICSKIKHRINIMSSRLLNIFQKAILINTLIASELWFTAHVYPLPMKYATIINTEIYKFLWNKYKTNPIKREVLNRNKLQGGIGLLNVFFKARSIFVNSLIKVFLKSEVESMINHYMATRINYIFNFTTLPSKNSMINAPYYEYALEDIKLSKSHKDFPNMNSKSIYSLVLPDIPPIVETQNPLLDWGNIWKNINFKYIDINDRPILYKYVHQILPTNKRLFNIRLRNNPLCDHCFVEDSNNHKFYDCQKVQNSLNWVRRIIVYFCDMYLNDFSSFITLDLPKINIKVKNTLNIILSSYIVCSWYCRDDMELLEFKLKAKMIRDHKLKMGMLKD